MKRIALYGGVFDPVHLGHMGVIEQILSELQPDELIVIPCGNPPHKKGRRISDGTHRAEMLRLATKSFPNVTVSEYEIEKQEPSYTLHTLEYFKKQYGSDTKLFWVIGADNIQSFSDWHRPDDIVKLATMAVLSRPGFDRKEADSIFSDYYVIGQKEIDVSSTQIRERIRAGNSISGLVPSEVEDYIKSHSLYPPTVTIPQAEQLVKDRLRTGRALHTFGVRDEAVRLAKRFGANEEKAALSALLHDITKQVPLEEQLALCKKHHITLDAMQQRSAALLHGITAEAVAFYQLGIDDNDILSAIRYHTTGCANMNLLMKIIYLADAIEEGREDYPGLSDIRILAQENLDKSVLMSMERGLTHLRETDKPIHPDTLSAIESLKGGIL